MNLILKCGVCLYDERRSFIFDTQFSSYMFRLSVSESLLQFKQPAGTSRGVYTTRDVCYIEATDETGFVGVGESSPLPDLSCDVVPNYPELVRSICKDVEATQAIDYERLRNYPSVLFGIETALLHLKHRSTAFFDTPFSRGEQGIRINGLIWMGTYDEMFARIKEKLDAGFKCVKLKIGAIDFDRELALIAYIRQHFSAEVLELRVDANGAFPLDEVDDKLAQLSKYQIHSIEQPIKAGQWKALGEICAHTPIPIALDEELIGVNEKAQKEAMLDTVKPQYIILKPTLHGGMRGCDEWISMAEARNIGWWATSALESNVGLNAIAQWVATHNISMPQGLGTGLLFTTNVPMPLQIVGDCLWRR